MSRSYNARRKRKAERQQAQAATRAQLREGRAWAPRLIAVTPVLIIASILAIVGILGFGSSTGVSKRQVEQEVGDLLSGIPQRGPVLGSLEAPITLWVYADLQCPTVKLFAESYLPAIVNGWVRTGVVKLTYRSLETDTYDEKIFFKQEMAALAAGRQQKMWDFLLTFARQQGAARTDYVTEDFLADIASQISGLRLPKWQRHRDDAVLAKQVALGVHSGRISGLRSTPSFLISLSERGVDRGLRKEVEASLLSDIKSLREEADEDFPTIRAFDAT